jgi:hypothetical protein
MRSEEPAGVDPLAELQAELALCGEMEPEVLASRLQADQARRWRAGCGVPVEAYLDVHPRARGNTELIVDLILGEILLRSERGERADPAEYARRFPEMADALAGHFELGRLLNAEADTVGLSDAPDPSTAGGPAATAELALYGVAGVVTPPSPARDGLVRGTAVRYFGDYEIRKELGRVGPSR